MTFEEMQLALQEVKRTRNAAEHHAQTIADLFEMCIEDVSAYRLARIKRKLRRFDAHRKEWKR